MISKERTITTDAIDSAVILRISFTHICDSINLPLPSCDKSSMKDVLLLSFSIKPLCFKKYYLIAQSSSVWAHDAFVRRVWEESTLSE